MALALTATTRLTTTINSVLLLLPTQARVTMLMENLTDHGEGLKWHVEVTLLLHFGMTSNLNYAPCLTDIGHSDSA